MMTIARLKIGDIAKQTGVSVGTLRYYETLRLLYPAERGNNGYRYYGPEAIQQVQFIKKSQALGFSLEEIRRILDVRDRGEPPCLLVKNLLDHKLEELDAQISQITAFKRELEGYRDRWAAASAPQRDGQEICPLIATVPLQTEDP